MSRNASWMDEEDTNAEKKSIVTDLPNADAPRLVRAKKPNAPPRATKGFFIQEKYSLAFDKLVFDQKLSKGKKAPELAEEAIELLLKKYKQPL